MRVKVFSLSVSVPWLVEIGGSVVIDNMAG